MRRIYGTNLIVTLLTFLFLASSTTGRVPRDSNRPFRVPQTVFIICWFGVRIPAGAPKTLQIGDCRLKISSLLS